MATTLATELAQRHTTRRDRHNHPHEKPMLPSLLERAHPPNQRHRPHTSGLEPLARLPAGKRTGQRRHSKQAPHSHLLPGRVCLAAHQLAEGPKFTTLMGTWLHQGPQHRGRHFGKPRSGLEIKAVPPRQCHHQLRLHQCLRKCVVAAPLGRHYGSHLAGRCELPQRADSTTALLTDSKRERRRQESSSESTADKSRTRAENTEAKNWHSDGPFRRTTTLRSGLQCRARQVEQQADQGFPAHHRTVLPMPGHEQND